MTMTMMTMMMLVMLVMLVMMIILMTVLTARLRWPGFRAGRSRPDLPHHPELPPVRKLLSPWQLSFPPAIIEA